jgi:endo-1,3(4)-beta-glucanase
MAFGATEGLGQRQLTSSSKLHATLRYGGSTGSSLTIPFVRGMAYATGLYYNLTPKITSAHAIININGQGSQPGRSVTGTKFKIGLNNGQTWLLYAEKSLTLSQTQGNILQATAPFTGYLRLAVLPAANAESMLDNYADAVPMNATVSFQSASMGAPRSGASSTTEVFDLGRMVFNFKKYGNQQKPLLMYALPHH